MGAPSVNLKLIIAKLARNVDKGALRQSVLFYVPSIATTLFSFVLFATLRGSATGELNKIQVAIMSSVILSLVLAAGIQFLTNTVVGEANSSEDKINQKPLASGFTRLGIVISIIVSVVIAGIVYPYFSLVLHFSGLYFSFFVILLIFYAVIWVLTVALWASGRYIYPAITFLLCYIVIFILGDIGYHIGPVDFMVGYTAGVALLLSLLTVFSWSNFSGREKPKSLWQTARMLPDLISKNYWGILFQTFFILAIFLDKIIVWISAGVKAGTGLLVMGPYSTGSFLGLVPSFSLVVLAYFAEKVKPMSKNMWTGSLRNIRNNIQEYKRLYKRGLLTMVSSGFILMVLVVGLSQIITGNVTVTVTALTIGMGVLLLEVILFNAFVLPVFRKSNVSAFSVIIICLVEIAIGLLVPKNVWFASLGFLVGSFIGFLLSYFTTRRLLSEFDYNAFHAFQMNS